MNFNQYRLKLILLILLLIAFSGLSVFLIANTNYWLISLWTILIVVAISIGVFRMSEQYKRRLLDFITSITHEEFKSSYIRESKKDDLLDAFTKLQNVYQDLRIDKEKNHRFLKTIVEHINIAMLCFDEDYNIVIKNQAAMDLFDRIYLLNIEAIKRYDQELLDLIFQVKNGDRKLYKLKRENQNIDISVLATEFKLQSQNYKLITLQDINAELEAQEIESWRKLVRVLTHEIMNTAIPISTLASVTNQMLLDESGSEKSLQELGEEDAQDLRHSLKTIENRSKGIVEFVKATKSYTNIPKLSLSVMNVLSVVNSVVDLMKLDLQKRSINVILGIHSDLEFEIDKKLIEQVLINVLKNSMDALENIKDPQLSLIANIYNEKQLKISIKDNGLGMDAHTLENALIPFFTTKKEGSGVGLSLSRQIMRMHHGALKLESSKEAGTNVILEFPIQIK